MECDLVKFAKYLPTPDENQHVIDKAFEIINRTKIILEPEQTAAGETEPPEKSAAALTEPSEAIVEKEVE